MRSVDAGNDIWLRWGSGDGMGQDPGNYREALRECRADEAEGADIMMVKPAGAYLDVIRLLRDNTTLPVSAYQVGVATLTYPAAPKALTVCEVAKSQQRSALTAP